MLKFFINFAKITELLTSKVLFTELKVGKLLTERNKKIAVAESCTGGLLSSFLTDVSGSSSYIFSNFVTYSNEAKHQYLEVQNETLEKYGAVSEQTAKEMAEGLLKRTNSDYAIATTGIAGPTGGTDEKPVGLMYIGLTDGINTKVVKIMQPPQLYRRIMKIAFCYEALKELYLFIR